MRTLLTTSALAAILAVVPAAAQDAKPPVPQDTPAQRTAPVDPAKPSGPAAPSDAAKPAVPLDPSKSVQSAPAKDSAPTFTTAKASDQWLGSTIIGMKVRDSAGSSIGEVNNLLLARAPEASGTATTMGGGAGMRVVALVVGVGGFLGFGEKNIAVDSAQFDLRPNANGTNELVLKLDRAQLDSAPVFEASPRAATSGSNPPKN